MSHDGRGSGDGRTRRQRGLVGHAMKLQNSLCECTYAHLDTHVVSCVNLPFCLSDLAKKSAITSSPLSCFDKSLKLVATCLSFRFESQVRRVPETYGGDECQTTITLVPEIPWRKFRVVTSCNLLPLSYNVRHFLTLH